MQTLNTYYFLKHSLLLWHPLHFLKKSQYSHTLQAKGKVITPRVNLNLLSEITPN